MGQTRFEVYPERDSEGQLTGGFRWRLRSHNGEAFAQATEAYTSRAHAVRACSDVFTALKDLDAAPVVQVEE